MYRIWGVKICILQQMHMEKLHGALLFLNKEAWPHLCYLETLDSLLTRLNPNSYTYLLHLSGSYLDSSVCAFEFPFVFFSQPRKAVSSSLHVFPWVWVWIHLLLCHLLLGISSLFSPHLLLQSEPSHTFSRISMSFSLATFSGHVALPLPVPPYVCGCCSFLRSR